MLRKEINRRCLRKRTASPNPKKKKNPSSPRGAALLPLPQPGALRHRQPRPLASVRRRPLADARRSSRTPRPTGKLRPAEPVPPGARSGRGDDSCAAAIPPRPQGQGRTARGPQARGGSSGPGWRRGPRPPRRAPRAERATYFPPAAAPAQPL